MPISIRAMRPEEARLFLEIHRASVRGLAVDDYPASVIDAWAPLPITDAAVERFLDNCDQEIRLIAELDGRPVGIGALVLADSELRACYVAPDAARQGGGTALVSAIEEMAREHGVRSLHLEASITAEAFYAALGYVAAERGELVLPSGVRMAAIRMRKRLA